MNKLPIITDPFILTNEGTFRFVRNCQITYWNTIEQQCVEKLVDNKWSKLDYEESHRIAKQYLKEYK